jgi:hypothetical protein
MTGDDMKNNRDEIDDWFHFSANKKLLEKFIREFQDKLDWTLISHSQELSLVIQREGTKLPEIIDLIIRVFVSTTISIV